MGRGTIEGVLLSNVEHLTILDVSFYCLAYLLFSSKQENFIKNIIEILRGTFEEVSLWERGSVIFVINDLDSDDIMYFFVGILLKDHLIGGKVL